MSITQLCHEANCISKIIIITFSRNPVKSKHFLFNRYSRSIFNKMQNEGSEPATDGHVDPDVGNNSKNDDITGNDGEAVETE